MRPRAVVVAHRETMIAQAIAEALGTYPAIMPVGSVTTAEGTEAFADRTDAVALDSLLPGAQRTAWRLRKKGVRVIFLDEAGEPPHAESDGDGVRVSTHDRVSSLAAALVPGVSSWRSVPPPLSVRQREILALVARGFAGKEVARRLGISPKTVEQHKTRIFEKLGVPNQAAAVRVALQHGLERSLA